MAAISGILATYNAQATDLVGEYQETIFVRNSKGYNVGTTLFGLMARLKVETADNIEFNWWERDPVRKTVFSNAAFANTATTTLTFDDGAAVAVWPLLVTGMVLRNDRTGEYVRVTTDPTDANITVSRGFTTVSAAAILDNDEWTIVTVGKAEGAAVISSSYEEPSLLTNYIQTFNSSVEVTNAFKGSVLRTDIEGPLQERRIQALEKIGRDIELGYLLGAKKQGSSSVTYYTGGVYDALRLGGAAVAANLNVKASGSNWTIAELNTWLQAFMPFGSEGKLALCGPAAYAAVSTFANSASAGYRIMQNETVYGMSVTTINTPFGALDLSQHPIMREARGLRDWIIAVDLAHVSQKTFEPLFLEPNVQTPGNDSYKEQYRAKLGLKLKFLNAHGVAGGLTSVSLT